MYDALRIRLSLSLAGILCAGLLIATPAAYACEATPLTISHAQYGGTTLIVWVTNTGPTTVSGSMWIDFVTTTHGADQLIHTIMDLEPGDFQLISNHTIAHARTAYEDDPDPERRRHLLRLWLSFPER